MWVWAWVSASRMCGCVREKDQYISSLFMCESVLRSTIIQFVDVLYIYIYIYIYRERERETEINSTTF